MLRATDVCPINLQTVKPKCIKFNSTQKNEANKNQQNFETNKSHYWRIFCMHGLDRVYDRTHREAVVVKKRVI